MGAVAESVALGSEDRAILALERGHVVGHTCKVLRLDPGLHDATALRKRIAERLHLTPALMRRLGGDPATPVWEPDPGFELSRHVVDHDDGAPLDASGLARRVARLFEQRLERTRPLWQIDVLRLEGDQRALVWRIHHALADGTTAMRYCASLLWDAQAQTSKPPSSHASAHDRDQARRRRHLVGYLHREWGRSHALSPFDGTIGAHREVAFASVPLRPLHTAAAALSGATVNDAALAVVAGSLRGWALEHGHEPAPIRVKVPVSLHATGDDDANHDSSFSLELPVQEADAVARLRAIHAATSVRKQAHDAEYSASLLHRLSAASPRLEHVAEERQHSPRAFAVNVSNVPGPRQPVSVLGARVRGLHSLAEISPRHALRVAVTSLADQLCLGFCADPGVVPAVSSMAGHVEREVISLLESVRYC
jgi:hypothetical protein